MGLSGIAQWRFGVDMERGGYIAAYLDLSRMLRLHFQVEESLRGSDPEVLLKMAVRYSK